MTNTPFVFITLCILAGLAPAFTGCAKPAVQKYPPTPVYDKPMAPIGKTQDLGAQPPAPEHQLLAAVTVLEKQARVYLDQGELDKARATAERAVRIDPDNPGIWQLLAQIALAANNFDQAEQFAGKSNLYAGEDQQLRAENFHIISEALRRKK